MEISSFETTAFSRRQIDKLDAKSRSPLRFVFSSLSPTIGFVGVIVLIVFLFGNSNGYLPTGHIVTPGRLLVIMTILLIIMTPYVRSKSRVSSVSFSSRPMAAKPVTGIVEPPRASFEPPKPSGFNRLSADVFSSLAPVPSRFDISQQAGLSSRRSSGGHAHAPFLDDVNASLKHEYTSSLPLWARRLEDTLIMPMIVKPLVEELEESDKLITQIFQHYGAKLLAQEPPPGSSKLDSSQISLSDRYLPHPMSANPQVVNIWQKRQMLEAALTIPNFPRHYRDCVYARIVTWANRGGIRFAYRHDKSEDDEGPTDSHILAHVVFSALDSIIGHHQPGFRERYVVSSSGTTTAPSGDDFNTLFFSLGSGVNSKINTGVHQHCKIVWLEEVVVAGSSNRRGQPALHYNVATNQRVYGIQGGGGNLIEALSLFFHLLKQLSPSAMWVQLPHNLRMILEAAVGGSDSGTGSLTGSFFTSPTNPALGAPPFRGL